MSSLLRKIKRNQNQENERKEIKNIQNIFKKKPKDKCPKCNMKSLFYTNEKKETYCVRCEERVN